MELFGRVLRRALVRLIGGALRRRGLIGVAFAVAAAAITLSAVNLVSLPFASSSSSSSARDRIGDENANYQASDNEPNATASYARGMLTGDARLVWNAYSERAARDLQGRGINLDVTQRQLDESRQNGNTIQQVQYVAGYPIPQGSMHFYVVTRAGRARGDVAYVPYVFTLDARGKIDRID
jgi:hypothetical protein